MKIRLALREEGRFWNAYLAHANTMDDAMLIGSIMIGAARKNPDVLNGFKALMEQVIADAIKDVTGKAPASMVTQPAPESERSGNA